MAPEAAPKPYPLYKTTFTLHRLSPLYAGHSSSYSNITLQTLAHRLRDVLTGEILRGVRVGLAPEEDILARVGALQSVTWRLLPEEASWDTINEDEPMRNTTMDIEERSSRGWSVSVEYERMEYKALLLRDVTRGADTSTIFMEEEDGFEHFPLMMLKMPTALRETFIDFLASSFDCRVSALHLGSGYLVDVFESYLVDLAFSAEDYETMNPVEAARALTNGVKEAVISLGFGIPGGSAALKNVDITISREDIPRMVATGKKIGDDTGKGLFFGALEKYVQKHLALDLTHENVKIVRIACAAFVLGAEGKIKITRPTGGDGGDDEAGQRRATRRLVNGLVDVAKGGKLSAGKT